MSPLRRFTSEDIGVELFPAITSGLYRDPLDALREYVQNAMDAEAKHVEITLTPDLVSVKDDGTGMSPSRARDAIRLGISEKNPVDNIGFRGIGIYSSFELCDCLEIHTRPRGKGAASVINVDFAGIRGMLADEEQRRTAKQPPQLHLERMLSQAVTVSEDADSPLAQPGTLVLVVGLRAEVFRRLNKREEVETYLQNTVPLPFDPSFRYAKAIGVKLRKRQYRTVQLVLNSGGRTAPVYRPYTNAIFHHGGEFAPEFFDLQSPTTKVVYGFAWVCFNDARKVLSDTSIRGLLVKKHGFSIGDRKYLEPLFGRTVFSRRITGEVIVEYADLVPNAARSDFENTKARPDFQLALARLIADVSRRADEIQEELKAREVLDEDSPRVFEILGEVPTARRDTERLLALNVELNDISRRLATYETQMRRLDEARHEKTLAVLEQARKMIGEVLTRERKQTRRELTEQAAPRAREAPTEQETRHRRDRPRTLLEVLDSLDIVVTAAMRAAIAYIDEAILKTRLEQPEYERELEALRDHLEENV